MKKFLNLFIIQLLFIHSVVWANDGRVHIYKKQNEISKFIDLYNTNPKKFFDKTKHSVFKRFKTDEDKKYYESLVGSILTTNPNIKLSFKNHTLFLKLEKQFWEFKVNGPKNMEIEINKKLIKYEPGLSLESFTQKIAKIMGTKPIVNSFFEMIIGSAYAGIILLVIAALVAITAISWFIGNYLISSVMDLLDEMLAACEQIVENVKYEETKFYELYSEFVDEFGSKNIEEISGVSCTTYVRREYQKGDISFNREEIENICKKGQKASDCHKNNQINVNKSNTDRNLTTKEIRLKPAKLTPKKGVEKN
jgi:hypothetical protein